ncbi:uncharacterized protein LOC143018636 isoform X3 [Oratosquilla oratoria]|uniref:uncharacterized protein LOC143018636 isoform X3 n=1 Tax=Oratosquilla oratoria TaxID=337810 RepID=UPI003F772274
MKKNGRDTSDMKIGRKDLFISSREASNPPTSPSLSPSPAATSHQPGRVGCASHPSQSASQSVRQCQVLYGWRLIVLIQEILFSWFATS